MRSRPSWSFLALLFVAAALSLAALDGVALASQEDTHSQGQEAPVTVTAYFTTPCGRRPAELFVTARLKPGYWLYSITQPSGGPHRTIIILEQSPAFRLRGPFTAIQQPLREKTEWPEWPVVEKHPGCVTWHAVVEFAPGVDPSKLTIKGAVQGQVDTAAFCLAPTAYPFIAALGPAGDCEAAYRLPAQRFMCRLHAAKGRLFHGWLGRLVKRSQAIARQWGDSGDTNRY